MLRIFSHTFFRKIIPYVMLLATFFVAVFFYYYGTVEFGYVVPSGDDPVRHISGAMGLQEGGLLTVEESDLDPPFLRILLASLSFLSGFEVLPVTLIFLPFVAILVTFSIYVVSLKLFKSKKIAVLSVLLFLFYSFQPTRVFEDGTYMNLFAALFIFPLFVAFYSRYILRVVQKKKFLVDSYFFASLVLGAGVMFFHSLSSVYLFLFLGFVFVFGLYFIVRHKVSFVSTSFLTALFLLLGSTVAYGFFVKRTLVYIFSKLGFIAVDAGDRVLTGVVADPASVTPQFGSFVWHSGYVVLLCGVLGFAVYLLRGMRGTDVKKILYRLSVLAWPVALFVGAKIKFIPLSERFARDLTYPLIVFSAYLFFVLMYYFKHTVFRALAFSFVLFFVSVGSIYFITNKTTYNPLVRVQGVDYDAYRWVKGNIPNDAVVLATPGVVSGDWGSYAEIITGRVFLDGAECDFSGRIDLHRCSAIYDPNSQLSRDYYRDNNVQYVFQGKRVVGPYHASERTDWRFERYLSTATFLERVQAFQSDSGSEIVVYKVNSDKL